VFSEYFYKGWDIFGAVKYITGKWCFDKTVFIVVKILMFHCVLQKQNLFMIIFIFMVMWIYMYLNMLMKTKPYYISKQQNT